MGFYSCIGTSLEAVRDALYEGKSGIIFDPERKAYGYRSALTGFVPAPQLKGVLGRRLPCGRLGLSAPAKWHAGNHPMRRSSRDQQIQHGQLRWLGRVLQLFGSHTPVSSTKSMTGHECWMAGASELVYSILMMQNDFIAPNINIEALDEDSQKLHIITQTTQQPIRAFLSNSFGFGGTNSAIIVKCGDGAMR